MAHRITGIFASLDAAEEARRAMVRAGVASERMTLSAALTDDGVAAEAPGESFYWQMGEDAREPESSRFGDAVRKGACTLTVDADSVAERKRLGRMLLARGAREVAVPPA